MVRGHHECVNITAANLALSMSGRNRFPGLSSGLASMKRCNTVTGIRIRLSRTLPKYLIDSLLGCTEFLCDEATLKC